MNQEQKKYHRLGEPGGPGCPVGVLPVSMRSEDGSWKTGTVLDAGKDSTELELLRTIASRFGVRWGQDDLGWWAVVENREFPSWAVWRQDDNGNKFLVEANLEEAVAKEMVERFESTDHKQTYWVENLSCERPENGPAQEPQS